MVELQKWTTLCSNRRLWEVILVHVLPVVGGNFVTSLKVLCRWPKQKQGMPKYAIVTDQSLSIWMNDKLYKMPTNEDNTTYNVTGTLEARWM